MSLAERPVAGVVEKGLDWKPVIQPVQDSTPDGQPMERSTYLEHLALGVSLESGLMEGMSYTEPLKQSLLGECSAKRPEETDTPERPALASQMDHEQTCVKLLARTMPDTDIVDNADVSTDINTDRRENSSPRISSDSSLFKWNTRPYPPVQNTQGGRPMEGMTESIQEELLDIAPAVDCTNQEQLPTSYSREQSDSSISGNQDYVQNAGGKQFSCDTGLSSPELEDVIRREVLRNRLMGYRSSREVEDLLLLPKQVNLCDEEIALDVATHHIDSVARAPIRYDLIMVDVYVYTYCGQHVHKGPNTYTATLPPPRLCQF